MGLVLKSGSLCNGVGDEVGVQVRLGFSVPLNIRDGLLFRSIQLRQRGVTRVMVRHERVGTIMHDARKLLRALCELVSGWVSGWGGEWVSG